MKSVKVTIGGEEYNLIGEDESLIIHSANEANKLINDIKSRYDKELPPLTITTLALVNAIETLEIERKQHEEEMRLLEEELDRIKDYLENFLEKI